MITVAILINGQPIAARSAVRKSIRDGIGTYAVDDGTTIQHRYDDGAVALAIEMLRTIKEPTHRQRDALAELAREAQDMGPYGGGGE